MCQNNVFSQQQTITVFQKFQSRFREHRSTSSRWLKTFLMADDDGMCSVVVLLAQSSILLGRLRHWVGVFGTAFNCLSSYLLNRWFCVSISSLMSYFSPVKYGVPQGSFLGPLFPSYMVPLGHSIQRHGVSFHCYACSMAHRSTLPLEPLILACSPHDCLCQKLDVTKFSAA